MISGKLKIVIEEKIKGSYFKEVDITGISTVSGGCINDCYKLETGIGHFFVKINSAKLFPKIFEAEAKGLEILKSAGALFIPEVIGMGENEGESFIILEFIKSGFRQKDFFEKFGKQLAGLHQNTSELFGLDHDNYIGSLKQSNHRHKSWIDFFIQERLARQVKIARDKGAIDTGTLKEFILFFNRLNEIFPKEKPSLLHGDLWGGNFMVAPDGSPSLIDPSVYFGFREMDIAMTKLFGGFPKEFYESYHAFFPLEKGWESRLDICNLYPLMVHVNLFGGGYLHRVKSILKRFA